ncbi:MAG: hypothetical protein ABR907_09410 [Terracidiphilus sp.]|jgi:hypothetical protein
MTSSSLHFPSDSAQHASSSLLESIPLEVAALGWRCAALGVCLNPSFIARERSTDFHLKEN